MGIDIFIADDAYLFGKLLSTQSEQAPLHKKDFFSHPLFRFINCLMLSRIWKLLLWVWLLFSHSVRSDSLQPHYCSMPGFPVHYHLLELPQTHVHWVGDAIQPSQPLLSHSPLPSIFPSIRIFFNVSSSHQVAKVLEIQLQHQSFQWICRIDWFDLFAVQGTQEYSPTPQF